MKQNVVMKDFLEQNPDGKLTKGVKRGIGWSLTSVVKAEGFRKEKVETSQNPLWDFERFLLPDETYERLGCVEGASNMARVVGDTWHQEGLRRAEDVPREIGCPCVFDRHLWNGDPTRVLSGSLSAAGVQRQADGRRSDREARRRDAKRLSRSVRCA